MNLSCLFFQKQKEVKTMNVNEKPKERKKSGKLLKVTQIKENA